MTGSVQFILFLWHLIKKYGFQNVLTLFVVCLSKQMLTHKIKPRQRTWNSAETSLHSLDLILTKNLHIHDISKSSALHPILKSNAKFHVK